LVLKPAVMQRIAVLGIKDERQRVTTILYDLGAVQLEPLSKVASLLLRPEQDNASMREVSEELLRIRTLRTALPATKVEEKRGFASPGELLAESRSVKIDPEVTKLKQEESSLTTQSDELAGQIDLVTKLSFVTADLGMFDLESAVSFFGSCSQEAFADLTKNLASVENIILHHSGKDPVSFIVVVPKEQLDKFGSIIQKANLKLQRIPKFVGKQPEVLAKLRAEKDAKDASLKQIDSQLRVLSDKFYGLLSSLEEQLTIESRKLEAINNFGFTNDTFSLEGWIPRRRVPELQKLLSEYTHSTTMFKIEAEGKAPTLMETPKRLRFFESFIRFYSMPMQQEIDPTIIFAFTFPIFFGLMLGDVGYGVVVLLVSIWILNRVRHPGGRTAVPKMIRSFAKRIFKPVQFAKLARAMIPGSIIGIILGFAFNEYFGFHFNQYLFDYLNTSLNIGLPAGGAFLDPISTIGLKQLLLFAGYVGLFEVSFGLVLGMANGFWHRERKHVLGRLGWLFVAWGISLIGLTVLHHGNLNPESNPITGVYFALLVAGLGSIVFAEGAQSLLELTSIISHILSYTRLIGILLASVALALVINSLFLGDLASGPALAVVGVVILVFGQLFNIILAMFEPGIQGARLIYVEFFSKFFHGQGKAFAPFRGGRTYTLNEIELMQSKPSEKR
jgi:V/A-type H+/Na+-transporting ATPase subunit I